MRVDHAGLDGVHLLMILRLLIETLRLIAETLGLGVVHRWRGHVGGWESLA